MSVSTNQIARGKSVIRRSLDFISALLFILIIVVVLLLVFYDLASRSSNAIIDKVQCDGDPVRRLRLQTHWGLDKPLMEQYFIYLSNLLRGDLGISIRTGNPVISDLKQFFLNFRTIHHGDVRLLSYSGSHLGSSLPVYRNKPFDYLV